MGDASIATRRRIGSSHTTLIYGGGILVDFALITGAVAAINGAMDIGKGAVAIRDGAKASEVVRAMNEKLLNAQQRLFELSAALGTLQQENFQAAQELRELREALAERNRYTLFELVPGSFVYRVNLPPERTDGLDPRGSEPEHYVCQQCLDSPVKRKVVLRHFARNEYTYANWRCPVCRTVIYEEDRRHG
ncbi:hypothetical protein [Castellaniella sp. UC4442_H9]